MGVSEHWLRTVALRAGLPEADDLDLPANTPIEQAWKRALETLGLDEDHLIMVIADHYMTHRADFTEPSPAAMRLIPEKVVRVYHIFPLRENDREIYVATADPADEEVVEALHYASGRTPVFRIATPWAVQAAIDRSYATEGPVSSLLSRVTRTVDDAVSVEPEAEHRPAAPHARSASPLDRAFDAVVPAEPGGTAAEPEAEPDTEPDAEPDTEPTPAPQTAPGAAAGSEAQAVARLASLILLDAIRQGATRIIIESSGGGNGIVRFRVDGIERRYMNLSVVAMNRVIERLAELAGAAPGAGGRTGAARVKAGERTYAFHLVVGQMGGAQRAFVRIQDTAWHPRLDELGIAERELEALQKLVATRTGLVLIAGPEGSGRSTVARALLRAFVAGGRRPAAVEERAGGEVEGVAHSRPGPGGAMAAAVHAVSRGRDVLLVDEVHDAAALAAVVDAARDRLVVAVTDAPDAPTALRTAAERLGQPAALAAVARGVVALRQLRRLCASCTQPAGDLDEAEAGRAEAFGTRPARRAVGCASCGQTGYRGSVQVAAVMPVDARVRGLLEKLVGADELQRAARTAGYRPLLQVALARVAAGDTTLAEVERVVAAPPVSAGQPKLAPLVLVVDDDAETRVLARSALESAGYRVDEAADGERALQRLVTGEDCALVVLDLLMPGMDGHEVLHRIKSDILTAGVHVVVLTGSDNPEDERLAMAGGAEDYVRKPLDPEQFLARVAAALHRKAAVELVG